MKDHKDKPYPRPEYTDPYCIPLRSRQVISGPKIAYASFTLFPFIGGFFADIPVQCPFPINVVFLASVKTGDEADTLFISLAPTGKPRGSTPPVSGTEQIFYLTSNVATGPTYRTVVRFEQPVLNFFVSAGSENGHLPNFTLGLVEDDALQLSGGIFKSF